MGAGSGLDSLLYSGSLVKKAAQALHVPLNDNVESLRRNALAIFLYNQRALVFGVSLGYLVVLAALTSVMGANNTVTEMLAILAAGWGIGVGATLLLHRGFLLRLRNWVQDGRTEDLWPLFDRYFLLDAIVLFLIVFAGVWGSLPLSSFVFMMLANAIVYTSYAGGAFRVSIVITGTIFVLLTSCLLVYAGIGVRPEDEFVQKAIWSAPFGGMIVVSVLSVLSIARLRRRQHLVTSGQLQKLRLFESKLAPRLEDEKLNARGVSFDERSYRERISEILHDLCSPRSAFWYQGMCLWFRESHHDRGDVLLPGPYSGYRHDLRPKKGRSCPEGLLKLTKPALFEGVLAIPEGWRDLLPATAEISAFVPVRTEQTVHGFLVVFGDTGGAALPSHEAEFLSSLATTIATSLERWRERFAHAAQRQMNSLLSLNSLDSVFNAAADILQNYLEAAGCMIIFRPRTQDPDMDIVAIRGFKDMTSIYKVGRGKTGQCALEGQVDRVDDVTLHVEEFDDELLNNLEKAHRQKVESWMAIPIGGPATNHGVIKVINSRFRCSWFTAFDEELAHNLAVRLHVLITKFLHIQHSEAARTIAQDAATTAEHAKQEALTVAQQRQEDLMIITHQLQGALISAIGALSGIRREMPLPVMFGWLNHAGAFMEDAYSLCYGTATIFARHAGQTTSFAVSNVNALEELRLLAERLSRTTPRHPKDTVRFSFNSEPGFPLIRTDRDVFLSVFYSLVHNAMKYSDRDTEIVFEAGWERQSDTAALKVKSVGEPIDPSEADSIFEKFRRGRRVARGRRHRGVGLGLWVARELLLAMGGNLKLELTSAYPRLSVFVVYIPTAAAGMTTRRV